MPKSRQRNASDSEIESLWQTNDRRSVTQVTILDALTDGLAPFPSVTEFRPPTESSEPCSHSIRKAENPKFSAFIFRSGGLNWHLDWIELTFGMKGEQTVKLPGRERFSQ